MSAIHELGAQDINRIAHADRYALERVAPGELRSQVRSRLRGLLRARVTPPESPVRDPVLCLRSMVRPDYKALFEDIASCLPGDDAVLMQDHVSYGRQINPEMAARFGEDVSFLLDVLTDADPAIRAGVAYRLCLYSHVAQAALSLRPRAVVLFASMQPVEHMLCLLARRQGIPTVTMQHGLYIEYPELETVNRINYEHQPADHFLAWGRHTAELIARHNPGCTVHIAGKPSIFTGEPPRNDGNDGPKIMVVTDQRIFDDQNHAMIATVMEHARRIGARVFARFHPSNDKKTYLQRHPGLSERQHFLDCDLVIGHTSSLIYEAITLGCRTLRFRSDVPAIELPEEFTFSSVAELDAKAQNVADRALMKHFISHTGDESRTIYRRILGDLLGAGQGGLSRRAAGAR
jgi:hypothetical protein